MFLNLCQMPIGWKPNISNQVLLSMVQILNRTHYLPHASSYVPGSCSIRFSSSRRPEKSTTLIGLSLTSYGSLKS